MTALRLLVLSAGTQVGQNVLATLAGRRERFALLATSTVAHEPALFDYDAVYLVPPTAAEPRAFETRLLDILSRERVDLVVPCRDDDVAFLAALRDRRPDLAPRLLCGNADTAQIIVDKWHSAEFCTRHGLPFVPSLIARDPKAQAAFIGEHGYPLVAKPRRGYASQDVYLVSNEEQVARALARDGWVVQKFLGNPQTIADYLAAIEADGIPLYHTFQGAKHSIQALIAPDGSTAHVICTLNRSKLRRSKWVEPDRDPRSMDIGTRCAAAFAQAGWRGPLNIQCQQDAGGTILVHEFNGRFTGGTVDRWLLGHDEVGASIERFTGQAIAADRSPKSAALEAFESMVARSADPLRVAALTRDRIWRRAP